MKGCLVAKLPNPVQNNVDQKQKNKEMPLRALKLIKEN